MPPATRRAGSETKAVVRMGIANRGFGALTPVALTVSFCLQVEWFSYAFSPLAQVSAGNGSPRLCLASSSLR